MDAEDENWDLEDDDWGDLDDLPTGKDKSAKANPLSQPQNDKKESEEKRR